jgi:hypothetical protein
MTEEYLVQLAEKYNCDKNDHNYFKWYSQFLPDKCRSLMEVGVAKGASALLWDEAFGEDCDIHLVDLFMDENHVTPRWCRRHGFLPYAGSQDDIGFLNSIKAQVEIAIEDGSHNSGDQLITFKTLFLNNVSPGGLYVAEDLHCCSSGDGFYWNHGVSKFEDTILWMLQNYVKTGRIENMFFNEGESAVFESLIDWVEVCEDKIAFICKK